MRFSLTLTICSFALVQRLHDLLVVFKRVHREPSFVETSYRGGVGHLVRESCLKLLAELHCFFRLCIFIYVLAILRRFD